MKSGNLNFLEPSGPLQACNGTALPLSFIIILWDHHRICGPSLTETSLCGAYRYNISGIKPGAGSDGSSNNGQALLNDLCAALYIAYGTALPGINSRYVTLYWVWNQPVLSKAYRAHSARTKRTQPSSRPHASIYWRS